jgi:hypothetical protein
MTRPRFEVTEHVWPRPFCRPKPSPLRVTGALLALAAVIGAVAWIVGWVR